MTDLRLTYYRHNHYLPGKPMPPYRLRYFDLTAVLDGERTYRVDGQLVTLHAGDVLFLRAGQLRERLPATEKQDYVSFNFYCEECPAALPTRIEKGVVREVKLLLAACDAVEMRTREEDNRRRGYILASMLSLLEEHTAALYSPLTESILRYLHTHLSEKITLADLGLAVHFSPVYCDTVFKKETGRSIVDYVLDERTEEAKRLLAEPNLSLGDVALAVGFSDYNYFSRAFKKRVGYTPTQYRRTMLDRA